MKALLPLCTVLLLAGCATPAPSASVDPVADLLLPTEPGVHEITLLVNGSEATGVYGVPDAPSRALVVFAHGLGGDHDYVSAVVADVRALGAYAIGMDYRGAVDAYKVKAGVEDTLAATYAVLAEHPEIDIVVAYGHSMGGEITGAAIAQAPAGTFTHWVDGSGVMDLADEWLKMPAFQPIIEAETGGRPMDVPAEYAARSPLFLVDDIKGKGLSRAYIVHGVGDLIVPYEHAERMYDALVEAGVPVTLYEARTSRGLPCGEAACGAPPMTPAGHEVGLWTHVLPLLEHRAAGAPERSEPAIHGSYDGSTGTFDPSDVP